MATENLEDRILYIISQLCTVEPDNIKMSDRLREDLGMDSVSSMELLSMLAEDFDLDIEMEEAVEVTTVVGVIDMAKRHMADDG